MVRANRKSSCRETKEEGWIIKERQNYPSRMDSGLKSEKAQEFGGDKWLGQ
jgi:hypothetical protein